METELSDLPKEMLHHICSFLQFKDVLALRISSRSLHETLSPLATIPSFCFSHHDSDNCPCEHVFDFMINTVLQNRPPTLAINRISFSLYYCHEYAPHRELHQQWVLQLLEAFHVDELSLDYYFLTSIFESLPRFQSLKVLKLNMQDGFLYGEPPKKMELASLETLHIESITTIGASLGEWISESFPSLKHLSLHEVTAREETKDFTIQSSSLEDLTIRHLCCPRRVRVIAKNLRTLNFFFAFPHLTPYKPPRFELETNNLQRLTWIGRDDEEAFQNFQVTTTNPRTSIIMGESNRIVLRQLLQAMRSARELQIDTQVLYKYSRFIQMFKDYNGQGLIGNLRHMEIFVRDHIEGENYITFLERSSNLETLTLFNYPYKGRVRPYLKKRYVKRNFGKALRACGRAEVMRTKGLKKVKVIIRQLTYPIIVVVGLLLKSCMDLEEMKIYVPSRYHGFMISWGIRYFLRFETASPRYYLGVNEIPDD